MRILIPIGCLVVLVPVALAGFREGPLPNMAGGFGDPDCRTCHFDGPVNDPAARVSLRGVPAAYRPGRTYPITVQVTKEGLQRGGFELAARFASGPQKGKQAGTWALPEDGRVQSVPSPRDATLVFVQHTTRGSAAAAGSLSWTIQWTAPASSDAVQFNAAVNAANDDASPLGDFIYSREAVARAR